MLRSNAKPRLFHKGFDIELNARPLFIGAITTSIFFRIK